MWVHWNLLHVFSPSWLSHLLEFDSLVVRWALLHHLMLFFPRGSHISEFDFPWWYVLGAGGCITVQDGAWFAANTTWRWRYQGPQENSLLLFGCGSRQLFLKSANNHYRITERAERRWTHFTSGAVAPKGKKKGRKTNLRLFCVIRGSRVIGCLINADVDPPLELLRQV